MVAQKNRISFEYLSVYSKLLYQNSFDDFYSRNAVGESLLYDKTELNKFLFSNTISFAFQREIKPHLTIGIYGRKITRGIQSNNSYNIVSINDTSSLNPNYGGFRLIYRLKSFDVGLSGRNTIVNKDKYQLSFGIKVGLEIYDILELKLYTIRKNSGVLIPSGNQISHYRIKNATLFEKISNGLFKLGFYLSINQTYKLPIKNVLLLSSFDFGFSTPMITKEERVLSFLPDGYIIFSSLNFGLGYEF